MGTSSGQTYATTGRADDRRKAIFDEWFALTEGKGTSTQFASSINDYVQQHSQHLDPDLCFNSQSMGHFLSAKLDEGNSRVSRKAAEVKSKAPASWTIKTPVDHRPNITTIDVRTLAKLREAREQLNEILKCQPELPERVDGEDFWDAKDDMDIDGSRQRTLSPEYKLAVRNALYFSGCSQAKFPHVHATLVYFTIKELDYKLPLEDVLRVVPTDLASIIDFCADMDDYRLAQETKDLTAAFALSDKGDQKAGTSKNALTHNMVAGFNHSTGAPYLVHMGAQEIERGGEAIAQSIVDDGKRIGIFEWFGSCTDSAADCIKGMVKEMRSRFSSFIAAACFLHVMNLVLVNSYLAAFGDEERGVCSALRIGYMMSYLHHHFHAEWVQWCRENGYEDIAYIAQGAAKTRWWSVVAAFGDCYRNKEAYSAWCEHMAKVLAGTTGKGVGYYDCFVETAGWLKNGKAMTDMAFVVGFCRAFWDEEMAWLQDIAEWQRGLDEELQRAGFRSAEMPLRVIIQRRRLQALDPWDDDNTMAWSPYIAQLGALEAEQQEQSREEAATFLSTALDVHGRHSVRWLTDLVDCIIAHHNRQLAVACAAALLAIYDGDDLPVVDGAVASQVIDGEALDLNETVPLILQFTTAESLRETSVFFTDADTVEDIRKWVAAGGEFLEEWGLRLQREMRSKVNGRPMQSHCVERAVNVASCLVQKCGSHERGGSALSEDQRIHQRAPGAAARGAAGGAAGARRCGAGSSVGDERTWAASAAESGCPRQARPLQGDQEARGEGGNADSGFRAQRQGRSSEAEGGGDRPAVVHAEADQRENPEPKGESSEEEKCSTNSRFSRRRSSSSRRSSTAKATVNKFDLTSTTTAPSRAVLALELEERGLADKVKRAGERAQNAGEVTSKAQDLIDALKAYHGGDVIVPKLTSFEGTKKSRRFDGDSDACAFKRQSVYNTTATAMEDGGDS